jgi:hypothetical protein
MSNAEAFEDAFNLLCGTLLGEGVHRKVFACRLRPELVVKVEAEPAFRYFANVHEMKMWNDASPGEMKWLAPCRYLSPDGRILLQERADPVPQDYEMPERMPSFLTDFKRENFGILRGKLVCIDYAILVPSYNSRLKVVHWS